MKKPTFKNLTKTTEAEEIKKKEEQRKWVLDMEKSLDEYSKKNEFEAFPMLQITPNQISAGFTILPLHDKDMSEKEMVKFNKKKMPLFMKWQKENKCMVEPVFMTGLSQLAVVFIYKKMEDGNNKTEKSS